MSRPVDWTPLSRSTDPAPGDPCVLRDAARHYTDVAEAISRSAADLRRIASSDEMRSDAVDAFRDLARQVADDISRAHDKYAEVGPALATYADALADAQSETAAALVQARQAQDDAHTATSLQSAAQHRVDSAPPPQDTTADQASARSAGTAATQAASALASARRRAQHAVDARDGAADRAARAIEDVEDSGDLSDSWWDDWGADVVTLITTVADWVATVAGVLALVLAFIPVVGQALAAVLGTIALVASLVSLAGHIALAATGREGWSDVAWAAVGVLSFGVGRAALVGARVSAAGVRGASRLAAGRTAATSGGLARAGTTSARTAITRLLGETSFADVMGRGAARTAAAASRAQGAVPSLGSVFADLRGITGEFRSGLSTLQRADWGQVWAQLPSALPRNLHELATAQWGPEIAEQLAAISRVDASVLHTAEVGSHLDVLRAQEVVRTGADLLGAGLSVSDGLDLVDDVWDHVAGAFGVVTVPAPQVSAAPDRDLVGAP